MSRGRAGRGEQGRAPKSRAGPPRAPSGRSPCARPCAAWRHPRGPCCWPRPTAPLAAGPCVRLLGEESRGGRARRGRKAGELLAEGDEQGGETSRENRRGGERAGEGRELTLEDCRRAAPAGRSFQARSRGRAALAGRRSRRGRSSAGLEERGRARTTSAGGGGAAPAWRSSAGGEEQRRRVKLPFGARLRAGIDRERGNLPARPPL